MRMKFLLVAAATVLATGLAQAGSQSSSTHSSRSSNNGVVRERTVETYCQDTSCETRVERRTYRDDRSNRRYWEHDRYREYDRRRSRGGYSVDEDAD